MCFLIESSNQVTEFQVSLPASIQDVADRLSKHVAPIAVLQRIEKKKALCSHNVWVLRPCLCSFLRDQLQRSPNRFRARIRSFRGRASNRCCERRKRGERRLPLEESWILRVTQPARSQRWSRCHREFWHALVEIDHQRVRRNHFSGDGLLLFAQQLGHRCITVREASRRYRALHNPCCGGTLAARSEHGIVRFHRSIEC